MPKSILSIFFYLIILSSCSEEYSFDVKNDEVKIVVEGAITNEEGPYFFKLSQSQGISGGSKNTGISNALVILKDNEGNTDTLNPLPSIIHKHPKWYYYYLTIKKYSGIIDTVRLIGGDISYLNGIYYTNKIKGKIHNQYHLYIDWNGVIVEAEETMAFVPSIDSVSFREHFLEKDGQNYFVPYVFFKEPKDQNNYYMFNFGGDNLYSLIYSTANVWQFSILNDRFLNEYVDGYYLDDGVSPIAQVDFFYFNQGEKAKIRMLSISQQAYNFYESIIDQFSNDGGAYSPTPASPPTNLSGNALGYFRVSAVSELNLIVH